MASSVLFAGLVFILYLTNVAGVASAENPLQDFYEADPMNSARANDFSFEDPKLVTENDFFSGLHIAGYTSNVVGYRVTPVTVSRRPKVLQKGDVFVFSDGLVHFQRNCGYGNVVAIATLSGKNAGVITIANAVLGSKPNIASDLLARLSRLIKLSLTKCKPSFRGQGTQSKLIKLLGGWLVAKFRLSLEKWCHFF
ncbi:hypothetical protein CRG98_037384 [Punica granatum]|uniref:Germin-like protein n=1 Tax=Punica granatum TaxID=22663 RepID=A0A2I0IDW5_PUNGR|nr:hypothetical protein CRG98_037384 [Punica granatum]